MPEPYPLVVDHEHGGTVTVQVEADLDLHAVALRFGQSVVGEPIVYRMSHEVALALADRINSAGVRVRSAVYSGRLG